MKIIRLLNQLLLITLILSISFQAANAKENSSLLKNTNYDKTNTIYNVLVSAPGLIQAENYASVTGEIQVESSSDEDGTSTIGYFDPNDVLFYNVAVTEIFTSKIRLRVASDAGGTLVLGNENGTLANVQIPSTGGWTEWSTIDVIVDFPVSNQFTLTTATGGVNVNWIDIIENDCPTVGLATLDITAETFTILPEQSIQLYAEGADACGTNVALNPTWSSNAPNGFFTAGSDVSTSIITVNAGGLSKSITINIERPKKKQNFVVDKVGRLQAAGNQIYGKDGNVVSLAGNSLFWSSAAPTWYSKETVDWLVSDWHSQVVRAVMSVNPKDGAGKPWNANDYVQAPEYTMGLMTEVINASIENDIYVMVDFHEHYSDQYTAEAVKFFGDIAKQYNGYDNIIYELWNEPINDSWSTVKAHAEVVIAEIRKYDPDNLIVVGTPFYSQRVDDAAANPINDNNVAYALHGYAIEPAHGALRRSFSVPTVGTEWGIGINDNGGGETGAWVDYWRNQDGGKIHVMWAVNNKQEDGDENWSILNSNVTAKGGWSQNDLSTSGKFQKDVIYNWRPDLSIEEICEGGALASITVQGDLTEITLGNTVNLSASGTDNCGETMTLNGTWSSNAPNGVFTGSSLGTQTITYTDGNIEGTYTIEVLPKQAPVADAGEDRIVVQPQSALSLIGSATDAENDPITYSWTQLSGPITTSIESPRAAQVLVQGLSLVGDYLFELTASDMDGSSTDQVIVSVVANTPPTVDAGTNQLVGLGVAANLTAIANDTEGDVLTYSWSQVSGPNTATISGGNNANVLVSGFEVGIYVFEVAVNDGTSTVTDQVAVEVTAAVELLTNGDFSNGAEAWNSYVFSSATANNNIVNGQLESNQSYAGWESWHVQFYQGGLTIENGQKYKLKFRARAATNRNIYVGIEKNEAPYTGYFGEEVSLSTSMQEFEYEFTMSSATDNNVRVAFNLGNGSGDVYIDDVSLVNTTNEVINMIPVADAGVNQVLAEGTTSTSLAGSGSDVDGPQALTFSWIQTSGPNVTLTGANTENPSINGLSDGSTYTFELTVNDGIDNSLASSVTVTVEGNEPVALRIEAEDYSAMDGVQTENTSDTDGGLNVGYIDAWDWMAYDNITIAESGVYSISYRVASAIGGGRLKFEKSGGAVNYGEIDVPNTGGWQNWTTITHEVTLDAGNQNFAIAAITGGFNINWLEIKLVNGSGARQIKESTLNLSQEITMYPNPAIGKVTIKGLTELTQKVDLYNINGGLISTVNINKENKIDLDVTNLKAGIYFVYVSGTNGVSVQRLVKQ